MDPLTLQTPRLLLRRWRDADRPAFASLNADAAVVEHLPAALSRAESDALVDRIEASFEQRGYGYFAVEIRSSGVLAGFVGLSLATFRAPFTPAVEVGWRLARGCWGNGYATEAGRAAIVDGFERLDLAEVVSFTAEGNERSRRVMQRLGMTRDPAEDFDHPALPSGHRLRRHVLYRLSRAA